MLVLLVERLGYLGKDGFIVGEVGDDRGRHLPFRDGALGGKSPGFASGVVPGVVPGVAPIKVFALA